MNTKPQTTKAEERDAIYLRALVAFLNSHPVGTEFEEAEIARATAEQGNKVPKDQIRRLLKDVPEIDQELLRNGKVRLRILVKPV